MPDVFGANQVVQTFHSPNNGLAGVTLWLTAQSIGDEATILLEPAAGGSAFTAVIPASQTPNPYFIRFGPLRDSRGRDYVLRLIGPEEATHHQVSADVIPHDAYAEGVLYVNDQPVEADLAFRLCYRPSSLATMWEIEEQTLSRWWAPYDLVLNRMSQYKPVWLKKPVLLTLMTTCSFGGLVLLLGGLQEVRGRHQEAKRVLEQAAAMLLTLVTYSVTTGLIAQLVIFPNPISARAVDSAHSGPVRDGEVVTYDFLLALASGQAAVERAENVDVRWFGLGDEARPVLWMHPPASAAYSVTVPAQAALEIAPAIHPQVWLPEYGDGVLFTVQVNDGKRDENVFYQAIDAKNVPEDRRWHDTRIDLEPYAGQQVTITFTTDPMRSNGWDWAGWGTPILLMAPASN